MVAVQTKPPQSTYIYNLLSLKTAKEYAIYQRGPRGADILTSLQQFKNKYEKKKKSLWPQEALKKENEQDDMQHEAQQPSASGHQGSQELEQI